MSEMNDKGDPKEKTILVVDDDESICIFLKALLEKEGFNTEIASDGNQAVRIVENKPVDLIILDWMMPILSGFEVLRMLQTDEHRGIPVIVITARVTDRSTVSMIKSEINVIDFMNKPIQHVVFKHCIHQTLNTISPEEKAIKERFSGSQGPAGY